MGNENFKKKIWCEAYAAALTREGLNPTFFADKAVKDFEDKWEEKCVFIDKAVKYFKKELNDSIVETWLAECPRDDDK